MTTAIKRASLLLLAGITIGSAAWGENETGFQFNFLPPGARSLGLGGAFIGLADDATAAYVNPAGLTNLTLGGPQVAIELRQFDQTTLFLESGRLEGKHTGKGIDLSDEPVSGQAHGETSGLSFLSLSYVLPRGFTLAAYRHQLANYTAKEESQGIFLFDLSDLDKDETLELCSQIPCRYPPSLTEINLKIASYGISGAYAFPLGEEENSESLSVGAGFSVSQLNFEFARAFFGYSLPGMGEANDRQAGEFYGPADFTPDNIIGGQLAKDHDTGIGFNLGVLWNQGEQTQEQGRWSLGAVYRKGPSFHPEDTNGSKINVRVPDVYGLGVAYSLRDGNTKVTLDYDRVLWSQRFDDIVPKETPDRESFSLADADELHFGFEKVVFVLQSQIVGTLRLGAWQEPSHEVEYMGDDPTGKILFPSGKDQRHWSAGFGLVLKEDYQLDTALDFSDRAKTVSFSIVKFF